MRRLAALLSLSVSAVLAGCASAPDGTGEPIRIREGTFHPGVLGVETPDGAALPPGPQITDYESANQVVRWGEAGKAIDGRTTPDAYSVGVRFASFGSGYWVVPVGATDPTNNGERVWSFTADFGTGLPIGFQNLQLAAIDAGGHPGPITDLQFCVVSDVPDNLNACVPQLAPPAAIISLTWDDDVDLDLIVRTPDGKYVDWKHPTTASPDGGVISAAALAAAGLGELDRDSNANCVIDGIRREDLIFQQAPRAGTWTVYANLFSACGLPSVDFRATVYRSQGADAGPFQLVEIEHADGVLTAIAANGGAGLGLELLEVTLP